MIKSRGLKQAVHVLVITLLVPLLWWPAPALADETCQSPFLPKVTGQEDYIYVWTLSSFSTSPPTRLGPSW